MKKVDSGEYYDGKQLNTFAEFKPFRAEEYYSSELSKSPPEIKSPCEHFGEHYTSENTSTNNTDSNELRNQLDRMRQSDPHSQGSADTSSSASSSSSSVSSASSTSSAASGGVAAAGASSAVAAVIILAVVTVGLFINLGKYIRTFLGMDYLTVTVDMDEFIHENKEAAGLCANNFTIEYETQGTAKRIVMQSGKHTYLITGLTPGEPFTYKIICTDPSVSSSDYYSQTLTAPVYSEPTGVWDELNNIISFDSKTKTASLSYSVFLSDYEHKYPDATFYICSTEQSEPSNMKNVICSSSSLDNNNFFKGMADGIAYQNLYLYIVGENEQNCQVFLFTHTLNTDLPNDWAVSPPSGDNTDNTPPEDDPPYEDNGPIFEIDKTFETDQSNLDRILLEGKLTGFDYNYSFCVSVTQYNSDGQIIDRPCEAYLDIDYQTMMYHIECNAYYGVSAYQYTIYIIDENGHEVTVFLSDVITITAYRDFEATYKKLSPSYATISYHEGYIEINVDPEFYTQSPDIFSYKLQVINSSGNLFGEYCGTEPATIYIYNCENLDMISFVYYDCYEYMGTQIEYASYNTEGIPFKPVNFVLSDTIGFDGRYFTVSYTCDTIYSYSDISVDMDIIGNNIMCTKNFGSVSSSGIITFSEISGEPGQATVSVHVSYIDSNGTSHELPTEDLTYDFSYKFSVTSVNADLSTGKDTIPIMIKFDNAFINNTYLVSVTDSLGYVNITVPITDGYCYFNSIPDGSDDELTITVKNTVGTVWGTYTYTISSTEASANYTAPSMLSCVNPGNALVTYNADGTINIYRKVMFSCTNENVYLNAFIYGNYTDDEQTGRRIFGDCYDVISRSTYAIIENIPIKNYMLLYYIMFDYDGVSYTMYTEMPSGSIEFPDSYANAYVSISNNQTTVSVLLQEYGSLENRIKVNGVEYQYTTYNDSFDSNFILVIDGEHYIQSVTIYFNPYTDDYDSINGDITLKGSLYNEISVQTMQVES